MRVLVFCAVFMLSLSSAHAFTQDEAKTVCKSLAITGVGSSVPGFGGEHTLLVGYLSETKASLGCLYIDKREGGRNYYLFYSDAERSFIQHLKLQKTTEVMPSGGSISRRSEKPKPKKPAFDMARAKIACDVLQQEASKLPINSRLLGFLHQAGVASERQKHGFVPGEARYLCNEYIKRRNQ